MKDIGAAPRRLAPTLDRLVSVHQLRLLTAVIERGGFSRAASALGLSQPAISHQLKALSGTIGTPVLEIIGRRVQLTQAGALPHEPAKGILAEVRSAEHTSE